MGWEGAGDGCKEEHTWTKDVVGVVLNAVVRFCGRRPRCPVPRPEEEGSGCEELAGDDEGTEEGVEGL